MNIKTTIVLLAVFVLTLSMVTLPGAVYGDLLGSTGNTPATQWVPAGPASDTILYHMYSSDTAELTAMCVGQPNTCVPQEDLSDIPVPGNALVAGGCSSNCVDTDSRFWVTTPTQQLGQLEIDFNHAASFWGIPFNMGKDGQTCTSPNGNGTTINCTAAAIAIRQGIAHLIDKVAFTAADLGVIGPNAAPMDNPLTPASTVLHSGYPYDNTNPNATNAACVQPPKNTALCNDVGPYAITPGNTGSLSQGTGQQAVAVGTPGSIPLGGVCSWDVVMGCSSTPISAFHYAADTTTNGFVNIGQPDFCIAAQDFIRAGLAGTYSGGVYQNNGMNSNCELTNEAASLSGGNVVMYGRASLGRLLLSQNLPVAICQLVALGASSCGQITETTIGLATAHQLVFTTGCTSASLPGCSSVGPNVGWQLYAGGYFFSTPTPDNQWALYDSSFASNFCGGSPGQESPNYDYICNPTHDTWVAQSQFLGTAAAAEASLQVAMDIFGNHTFNIPIWTPSIQYPFVKGWTGVSNAAGIGTAQGNVWSLLNAWNPNPQVCTTGGPLNTPPGPCVGGGTIRWGQKDTTAALNPFLYSSVVEADVFGEVYDSLIIPNPLAPTQYVGYMVNSYSVATPSLTSCPIGTTQPGGPGTPVLYTNGRGTFSVGACVKMVMRGDIPWQDIYSCAATDSVCLTSHVVTPSDVKFSFASFNATGSLIAPSTANTIDVVYNTNQLPSAAYGTAGGTQGAGVSMTFYIYLHSNNAWALNDFTGIPIIPQRLWVTQTASKLANGVFAPCTDVTTASCTADPSLTAGSNSDPILAGKFIGSGPWACASGPLGASGTTYGTGCAFNSGGTPTGQNVGIDGKIVLRRFANGANGLDANFAYFRSNEKFKQFQWAANGANAAATGSVISAINSCKVNAAAVGGVNSYAACQHWNSPDALLDNYAATAGTANGVFGGGRNTLPTTFTPIVLQIAQWIGRGAWTFGVPSYAALAGAQAAPQTLYSDASSEGDFTVASSATTIHSAVGTPATATITVALSGGPDNNMGGAGAPYTGTTAVVSSSSVTSSVTALSNTLSPSTPTATATLTVTPTATGTFSAIVRVAIKIGTEPTVYRTVSISVISP